MTVEVNEWCVRYLGLGGSTPSMCAVLSSLGNATYAALEMSLMM